MRRLALVVAAVAIIVLAARLWPDRTDTAAPTPAANPASAHPRGDRIGTDESGGIGRTRDQRPLRRHRQGQAGMGADRAGLRPRLPRHRPTDVTERGWPNLRPYLEPELSKAFDTTDLEKVPHGHYAGYQPLKLGDDAITIRVTYQEGWALVLYLASTGNNTWLVASLDEAVEFD